MALRRFDLVGRLDGVTRTPQGGIRATANLTRSGVFVYYGADGKPTRELRHPEDVFKADSLATLRGAPLTVGHPAMVTAENWRDLSVGHVHDDVRQDGKYVKATVTINDAATVARVQDGDLIELSCGYEADVIDGGGEYEGETFDARQVGQLYNHVALGPKDWGRAGSEVRLHLDGNADPSSYSAAMTVKTDDTKDRADALATATLENADLKKKLDATTGERDALKSEGDKLRAELDTAKAECTRLKSEAGNLIDPKRIDELVASRVSIEGSARAIVGDKFTAKKADGARKTDREIMLESIATGDPEFKADGKSDDYVRAVFEVTTKRAAKTDAAVADLGKATVDATKTETVSPIEAAQAKFDAENKKLRNEGAPAGSLTRK